MKRIYGIIFIIVSCLLSACHGFQDPNDLLALVPQAPYYLSVDKKVIESDGKDVAVLTITDVKGLVLTEGEYLRNTSFYITELDEWRSGLGASDAPNLFTSIADGTYTISAMYSGVFCENSVTVRSENRSGYEIFHKNVLIYKLTGTWCQYCPYMTEALHNVDDYTKDHSIVMAFHNNDTFSINYNESLDMAGMLLKRFGTSDDGYPYAIYSLAEGSGKRTVNDIQRLVKNQLTSHPAGTGIKAESVVENGKVTVNVGVKASMGGKYDLGIAILKDNQTAVNYNNQVEVYNDVVMMTSGNFFAMSSDAFTLSPGEEIEFEKVCEHPDLTPGSSCRVVLFTLTDNGGKVVVDNAVAFKIGESVDYRYNEASEGNVPDTPETVSFPQKVLGMQFTSIGCVNCPFLADAIKDVQKNMPGKMIPVAFHMDYGGYEDPMTLSVNQKFYDKVNTGDGLPMFALNFRKSSSPIINEYSKIVSEIQHQAETYPAVAGVAIDSRYDKSSNSVEVTAKFKATVSDEYRYHIFLVEDGIVYSQVGSDTPAYEHNNVFRAMAADNVMGTKLNGGNKLVRDKEYTVTKKMTLGEGWDPENMRVVVSILDTEDGGETFCSNNANECAVGDSVDYDGTIKSGNDNDGGNDDEGNDDEGGAVDPGKEGRFARRVCVMEFTGTWCAQCPDGATTLNYLIDRQYNGKAYALAFHNNDIYALPQEQELFNMFRWSGYPAFVTDMREVGLLNEGGCDDSIENSLKSATHCGVAVSSTYDEQTAKVSVNAKVFAERAMAYRIAAYVIEDKVKGEQTMSTGTVNKNYTHRHVVRKMLSSNVRGESLGSLAAGTETEKTFEFTVDEGWNLKNLSVAVLAIDKDGHVNNMAVCSADGGSMDYEYVNN
ncbi:MAG: Omp28-related outer membrane protein [Bacteroidales bacterium]|nr:Omp28-related outer membrane protein [Bacteroidales bacterium]